LQILLLVADSRHRGDEAGEEIVPDGVVDKFAHPDGVDHRVGVLHHNLDAGFAAVSEAVEHFGGAEQFGAEHIAAQVARAAVGGGVEQPLPLHPARVIGWKLQAFDLHRNFRHLIASRETF